jgi:hypothetical protein
MRNLFHSLLAAFALAVLGCTSEPVPAPNPPKLETAQMDTSKADDATLLAFARSGNLAAILLATGHEEPDGFYDSGPQTEGDGDAYLWLLVARDFWHAEADGVLGNLLELSSLRYDDGGLVTGTIEYQLGLVYLTGGRGLAIDLAKAELHLRKGYAGASETDLDFELDRNELTGRAREVFDAAIPAAKQKTKKNTSAKQKRSKT